LTYQFPLYILELLERLRFMKILKRTVVDISNWVASVRTEYLDRNGNKKIWDWFKRKNNQKAVCVYAIVGDKLVVTEEYRIPIEGYHWGIPAGLIDGNESPEETAGRELKEETGFDMGEVIEVSPFYYSSAGLTDEQKCLVTCKASGVASNVANEASEDIKIHLMGKDEILELVSTKKINIGSTAYFVMRDFVNAPLQTKV
jgi:ADP-ribose pyrophosphatase